MIKVNLKDKKIFGNEAGEDEKLSVLNSYYIEHSDFDDFFDLEERLSIVAARKGMGKSALLSRLQYKLINEAKYENPLVIRVKGNDLLGLGDFKGDDHSYLENYWKQIICKRVIVEIGRQIGFALNSDDMSFVELSELEGLKSKNIIGALIARVKGKLPLAGVEVQSSVPENLDKLLQRYQDNKNSPNVWILIDDIDAKFQNTAENQARVGSFFSAIRALSFDTESLNIRATVRSDVWSCLRHLEDLDKLQQYIVEIFWSKKYMRDMLAQKILVYVTKKFPDSNEAKYKLKGDYNKILDIVFNSPIEWHGSRDARLFDAISAFSNRRPRWMGQLCKMASKKAGENLRIKRVNLDHINFILAEFGALRRDDLIKEHNHQFDELSNLIDSLRATQKEFTYTELHLTLEENFVRGRPVENISKVDGKQYVEHEDLGDFLFKLGLISRVHEDGKTFTHYNDDPDLYRSIENKKDNIVWSIHPAYRTFLNIK
ncbi:P-loop ATPase, Sll1717 family [Agarivorans sp. Z349TD_8]|uniref:P-loop ATPase, Sll1717 family n=1 Tax=Agarivorans sp. Z349TD_8 TaxID=3421434 RepID=UPI003D7C58E1